MDLNLLFHYLENIKELAQNIVRIFIFKIFYKMSELILNFLKKYRYQYSIKIVLKIFHFYLNLISFIK